MRRPRRAAAAHDAHLVELVIADRLAPRAAAFEMRQAYEVVFEAARIRR